MKLNLTLILLLLVVFTVYSCGVSDHGSNKLYYSVIKKEKAVEQKDSLYASNDLAAVDSTIRRYYEMISNYNLEKSKNVNNPYLLKPVEWHAVNTQGSYVTSVDEDDIAELDKKYAVLK